MQYKSSEPFITDDLSITNLTDTLVESTHWYLNTEHIISEYIFLFLLPFQKVTQPQQHTPK